MGVNSINYREHNKWQQSTWEKFKRDTVTVTVPYLTVPLAIVWPS